jgi:hypothetical protein
MPEALSKVIIKCSFTIATILPVTAARTKAVQAKTARKKPESQTDRGHLSCLSGTSQCRNWYYKRCLL